MITTVLSHHGRKRGYEDLAQRFLEHAATDALKDLKIAQAAGLDVQDTEVDTLQAHVDTLVGEYGAGYQLDYGWARPLVPDVPAGRPVPFARLEQLANTSLGRVEYRLGNHHVHASSRTLDLHVFERGGQKVRLTGQTNSGFVDPANVAIRAALASTTAAVDAAPGGPDPMNQVALVALGHLAGRAIDRFEAAQAVVDIREARLQQRLNR